MFDLPLGMIAVNGATVDSICCDLVVGVLGSIVLLLVLSIEKVIN